MIFMTVALHAEAKPWIEYLGLKRLAVDGKYQMFRNERWLLVLSGPGPIQAAVATTWMFAQTTPRPGDLYVNVGVCGASHLQPGTALIARQILDLSAARTYYPDLLFQHPFVESRLATSARPVQADPDGLVDGRAGAEQAWDVVDMEAVGCYEAAGHRFATHAMFFLKVVSDRLQPERVTAQSVSHLMGANVALFCGWLEQVSAQLERKPLFNERELHLLEKTARALHLSVTMTHQLKRMATGYKARGGESILWLEDWLRVHAPDESYSKEGRRERFAQLRRTFGDLAD
jgi:adenosylhomocysteine nucleosidase